MRRIRRKISKEENPLIWLARKLEKLKIDEYINEIKNNFDKNELYEGHLWTPLKLIALMWWLTVYSRIIPKRFSEYWYIDLLAASGANLIKETGDIILGSPLLSHLIPYEPFKNHIYVECDLGKVKTLDRMLKHFGFSNYEIFHGDCNNKIYEIPFDKIQHYFCFIDCEGLEVKWSTVEHLLRYHGDILFVFQTSGVNRVFGKGKKLGYSQALNDFCGGDWWLSCTSINDLFNQYINRVREKANDLRRFKNFVDYVRVKGMRGSFVYEVVLICRKGPYTRAWHDLKKRLATLEDKHVSMALKICRGETVVPTLLEFFEPQKKLDNFL